jgi:hypothetical protein
MIRARPSLLIALSLGLVASGSFPALADGGSSNSPYYYFSQPGLTQERVLADFEECRELASMVRPPSSSDYVYAPGLAGAATVGFLQGLERGERHRNMAGAAFRKCMTVKGYRRHALSKDEAKVMYSGNWQEQRGRMVDAALATVGDHQRLDP